MRVVPGKSPTFIYLATDGKEMERVSCEGKTVEELADDLAKHGIYPNDYHPGDKSAVVGNLGLLEDEREDL